MSNPPFWGFVQPMSTSVELGITMVPQGGTHFLMRYVTVCERGLRFVAVMGYGETNRTEAWTLAGGPTS